VRAVKDLLSGTQGNPLYEWKNVNVIRNKVYKSRMVLHVVLRIKASFPSVDLPDVSIPIPMYSIMIKI
jgi:hypothetical protein